jgi:hypothetical protein
MALVGNISGSGGTSNTIGITGSLVIANPGLGLFPILPGNDAALFVSGNISAKPSTNPDYSVRGTTVFGGDVVISGTLFGGSPLYIGSHISASAGFSIPSSAAFVAEGGLSGSLQRTAQNVSYLVAGSNVTITSASNGQIFISSTGAGGGGTGTNFFYDTDGNAQVYTTGSVAFVGTGADYANNIYSPADKGADLFFYVSGSTNGTATALFGGDVVTSGSLTVRDGTSALSIADDTFGNSVITAAGSFLNLNANTRVIVQKDLEIQGANISAGSTPGVRNIFPENDTLAELITIGGAGGKTTIAGGLEVTGNYISGSAGVNLELGGSGAVTVVGNLTASINLQVNGNITTDADEDKDIFAGVTTKTITIGGGSSSNVRIPGNLTVNGTVVAIDTTNLRVKDAIVLIGSGTTSTSFSSVIAFSSGSKTAPNSLTFGASGGDDTLAAGIQDVKNGEETSISFASLAKVKAAAFKVATDLAQIKAGGTTDSIVVSGSQVILQAPTVSGVSFQSPVGTTYASVDQADLGETMFKGVGTTWFSGSSVNVSSNTGDVAISKGANSSLLLSTDGSTAGTIAARSGPGTPRTLTLTGSTVTIGANTSNSGITFTGAGNNLANFSAASSTTPSFVASQTNATFKVGTGGGTTDTLILSGTAIQLNAGASGQSFRRDNTEFLLVSSGAAGPNQRALITAAKDKTLVVGGTSETILSGSNLTLLAGTTGSPSGVNFSTEVGGLTQGYLNVVSGTYLTPSVIRSSNAAKIVPGDLPIPHDVLLGASAGKNLFLSGTGVEVNHGSAAAFSLFTDGTEYLKFSTGPGLGTLIGGQVSGRNVSLTAAGAGKMILSGSTTTLSGSTIEFIKDSTKVAFFGTSGNSTGLIPNATNTFDLGTPDLRWRNMYTGDLHLKNERGDWTIIEEKEYLSITNNKNGRRFKFVLDEI